MTVIQKLSLPFTLMLLTTEPPELSKRNVVHRWIIKKRTKHLWRSQVRASSYDSNKSTNKMQQFHKFITRHLCVAQHFRAPLRPSSGAFNCTRSLWFYCWSVAVGALLVVVWQVNLHDHDQKRCYHHAPTVKPEAPSVVVCSWWWAVRHPKHAEPHINVK
jgi:hypothetical protein